MYPQKSFHQPLSGEFLSLCTANHDVGAYLLYIKAFGFWFQPTLSMLD